MGIDPELFGPYLWGTMHFIALGAPAQFDEGLKTVYRSFYSQIPSIIPCASCGQHLTETMNALPIESSLTGSEALFSWTVDLHNAVNARLGKDQVSVTDARKIWMGKSTGLLNVTKMDNKNNLVLGLSVLMLLVFMGAAFYLSSTKRLRR
jgi:hypothetical protein